MLKESGTYNPCQELHRKLKICRLKPFNLTNNPQAYEALKNTKLYESLKEGIELRILKCNMY